MKSLIFAVDFDGTCVDHRYPDIGPALPDVVDVLKELTNKGHKIILWTMRSGKELLDAENWFKENEIPLYASNKNPTQWHWTKSPKVDAYTYIDDKNVGIQLIQLAHMRRPGVNWRLVRNWLIARGIL